MNNIETMLREAEFRINSGPDSKHYVKLNKDSQLVLVISYNGKSSRSLVLRPGDIENPKQFVLDIAEMDTSS